MTPNLPVTIRNADRSEFAEIGQLLVDVYSNLDGFPKPHEQPAYYDLLRNVGLLSDKPGCEIIVGIVDNKIAGAVVYFADMQYYGSGGTATRELNSSGFRLLGVHPNARGKGLGKILTHECINRARQKAHQQVIIHSTEAMQTAWRMYEAVGFKRAPELDFLQGQLPVFGFRLMLDEFIG